MQPPIVLMRLEFSPVVLRLDRYASSFGDNSVIQQVLHGVAKFLSTIVDHSVVEIRLGDSQDVTSCSSIQEIQNDPWNASIVSWVMSESAIPLHQWLLKGNDIFVSDVPSIIILLCSLNNSKSLIDVFTALKRTVPEVRLSLEQSVELPMAYALFQKSVYTPPPDLIIISKSIVNLRLR